MAIFIEVTLETLGDIDTMRRVPRRAVAVTSPALPPSGASPSDN